MVKLLSDIWNMLDACAEGWTKKEGPHNFSVFYGKKWHSMPTGAHGKGKGRGEVEISHVHGLLRKFDIEDCGNAFLGV